MVLFRCSGIMGGNPKNRVMVRKSTLHRDCLSFVFFTFFSLGTMSNTTNSSTTSPPATTALLAGSAGAFGAGLLGAIWYTQRKQNKRMAAEILEGTVPTAPKHIYTPPKYIPPVMTPAEKIIAKKEASLYAFKTLGYGTMLAFGGAGFLAVTVGWWLEVRNVSGFFSRNS